MRSGRKVRRKKKNRSMKILLVVLAVLVVGGGVASFALLGGGYSDWPEIKDPKTNPLTGEIVTELPSRPFILSTDNDSGLARPQAGISKADIVYEFPVEGGSSRLEPIYYSQVPDKIGPARSARPYFIDMAREYKAVFVHHGWSPQAKAYLEKNIIPYISAFSYGNMFYRSSDRAAPHNSYTTGKDVWNLIREKGWDEEQEVREFQFFRDGQSQEGKTAVNIDINYPVNENNYKYDEETGLYGRSVGGEVYTDKETGEQITTRNILVQKVKSKVLDEKGRLKINMTAGGDALLFTNGTVAEGKWSREDLDSPTIFTDKEGKEFKLNVGTTWIQVVDDNTEISYK